MDLPLTLNGGKVKAITMRILHTVASLAPRHGGPTEAALGMVRALRREGVDACILSTNDDVGDTLEVPLEQWILHEGVPCCFVPRIKARQHSLVGFTYSPRYARWLGEHGREFDFIHVHTVFSHPANAAMRIAHELGIPSCVRPLGQLCRWSMRQRGWLKHLQLALMTRRNINRSRFIHCTSRMEAEETGELAFTSPCRVMPHGIDLPPRMDGARMALRQSLGVPDDRKLVVFMSRFHEKKGIDLLLTASAEAREPFDLVLAGTGDEAYVEKLKQQVAATGLNARVHWRGFVQGDAKWELLQGGDVFALPSHSENFGIVVVEALACGLPVIISDQVALQEEVKQHALGTVVPLEAAALRQALDDLLASDDRQQAMRTRCLATARDFFSWSAAAQRLMTAYTGCLPPP